MRRLTLIAALALLSVSAFAGKNEHAKGALNVVNYPISVEQWVQTKSPNVSVNVNATLSAHNVFRARQTISHQLNKLAPHAKWRITAFNRTQNRSGLEQLQAVAQARLQGSALANLQANVKKISRPGMTYRIINIEFAPSFQEKQKARTTLRLHIYALVKQELARLNKTYPKQHYTVHNITFDSNFPPAAARFNGTLVLQKSMATATPSMPVSNKMILQANVTLASQRVHARGKTEA